MSPGGVVATGPEADPSLVGKRVLIDPWLRDWRDPVNMDKCRYFGSEKNGGFSDFTVVDHRNVHPVDSDLSDAELATFATSYMTAENMLNRAGVGQGDTVLIPGASGGVGSALMQLAGRRGAQTVGMAGADKQEEVRALGATAVLDRSPDDLAGCLRDAIGADTVSVVADVVGAADKPNALRHGGRQGLQNGHDQHSSP